MPIDGSGLFIPDPPEITWTRASMTKRENDAIGSEPQLGGADRKADDRDDERDTAVGDFVIHVYLPITTLSGACAAPGQLSTKGVNIGCRLRV